MSRPHPQNSAYFRQDADYPRAWKGRVPFTIRLTTTIQPPGYSLRTGGTLREGAESCCWVDPHGQVSWIMPNQELVALSPGQYTILSWAEIRSA